MDSVNPKSPRPDVAPPPPPPVVAPALLFEMARSFTTLARTLNLSHAVKDLGSTRQTLRRHIASLEEYMGGELFHVEDRRYQLTDLGRLALPEASELVARGNMWLQGNLSSVGTLQQVKSRLPIGWSFYQQQHSLSRIWESESPLLREAVRAWAISGGQLEAPEMAHVRPYLIVYRRTDIGWICVEFGEKCFYAKWFGWAKARSSIGRAISTMPGGGDFSNVLEKPYAEVTDSQGIRLDHICTQVPRADDGPPIQVSYVRMMIGARFPDGSSALLSLVQPDDNIEISGLPSEQIPANPTGVDVKFDVSEAKFENFSTD